MRKIKTFITAIILTVTLTAVYGESEMKKPIEIKESKLTSLSYVKKICKVTCTYKYDDCDIYKLDNGKGVLYITRDKKFKAGVIVKDGELYGRVFLKHTKGRSATYNRHDRECSIKGFKAPEGDITELTSILSESLNELADFITN